MVILAKFILVVATAVIAAAMLALIKIGAQGIFRSSENRWGASGGITIIFAWVIAFPVMVLLSLLRGLYLYFAVYNFHFIRN